MRYVALTLNSKIARKMMWGRPHLVADGTLIVPGVLNGSEGALLYPAAEIKKNPEDWNGTPILRNHPARDGGPPTGRAPEVFEKQGLGHVYKTRALENGKLKAQLWFDEERTRRLDAKLYNRLLKGEPIELSTGLYTDNDLAENGAEFNGRGYRYIARNYRPDHLAILPEAVGACSVKDGCGVHNQLSSKKLPLKPGVYAVNCKATNKPGPCDVTADKPGAAKPGGPPPAPGTGLLNAKPAPLQSQTSPLQAKTGQTAPKGVDPATLVPDKIEGQLAGSHGAKDELAQQKETLNPTAVPGKAKHNMIKIETKGVLNCGGKGSHKPGRCAKGSVAIKKKLGSLPNSTVVMVGKRQAASTSVQRTQTKPQHVQALKAAAKEHGVIAEYTGSTGFGPGMRQRFKLTGPAHKVKKVHQQFQRNERKLVANCDGNVTCGLCADKAKQMKDKKKKGVLSEYAGKTLEVKITK
jgi:hypothetical protein